MNLVWEVGEEVVECRCLIVLVDLKVSFSFVWVAGVI
jgi:hypothetical protein